MICDWLFRRYLTSIVLITLSPLTSSFNQDLTFKSVNQTHFSPPQNYGGLRTVDKPLQRPGDTKNEIVPGLKRDGGSKLAMETSPGRVYVRDNSTFFLWCRIIKMVPDKFSPTGFAYEEAAIPDKFFSWIINDKMYSDPRNFSPRYAIQHAQSDTGVFNLKVRQANVTNDLGVRRCVLQPSGNDWPFLVSEPINVFPFVESSKPKISSGDQNSLNSKLFNFTYYPIDTDSESSAVITTTVSDNSALAVKETVLEMTENTINVKNFNCESPHGVPEAEIEWKIDGKLIPQIIKNIELTGKTTHHPSDYRSVLQYNIQANDDKKVLTCLTRQRLNMNQEFRQQVSIKLNVLTGNYTIYIMRKIPTLPVGVSRFEQYPSYVSCPPFVDTGNSSDGKPPSKLRRLWNMIARVSYENQKTIKCVSGRTAYARTTKQTISTSHMPLISNEPFENQVNAEYDEDLRMAKQQSQNVSNQNKRSRVLTRTVNLFVIGVTLGIIICIVMMLLQFYAIYKLSTRR